jgi:MoxR-like ATPase
MNTESTFVPSCDECYVPFGEHDNIKKVLESKLFYPIFISGLSGNGKTFMVEQICAELKRDLYRVNITIETDEDDLLGGFRLVNGETSWFDGPVVKAMKTGAILLLDEVDLASTKIMCLQPVLEGSGIFIKKINTFIKPMPGFNIISTANTKGQGCDSGKFIGVNLLNEAFLERFPITIEQKYPELLVEKSILVKLFKVHAAGEVDYVFVDTLLKWAEQIRKNYYGEIISEIISTRRLVHIIKALFIFKERKTAVVSCIARFDDTIKQAFLELYDKFEVKTSEVSDSLSKNRATKRNSNKEDK